MELIGSCSTNVTVTQTTTWNNLQINIVDAVIDTPGNLSNALDANNLTALEAVLKQVPTEYEGKNITLFELLDTKVHGFTLFAPTDAAFASAAGSLASLQSNATAVMAVLGNHVRAIHLIYFGSVLTDCRVSSSTAPPSTRPASCA